ncbi:MAG: DUF350 domain-containing protein [Flavobacteriales bacterium]|jgi:uncharacterized membrane protein YjfL (UPF0719 family)|nr:DUF350 domain-containing protein [Flavobacteriales bacterium]
MNFNIALLAAIQIASSLTTGLAILWVTYRVMQFFGERYCGMRAENNVAFSIFMAGVLFSVGFSVSSVIQPLVSAFRLLSNQNEGLWYLVSSFILYGGFYVLMAYIASVSITVLGILIYINLTPLDEFEEIRKNNVGVALVLTSIIVVLNLMSRSGVGLMLESLVPYPDLPAL